VTTTGRAAVSWGDHRVVSLVLAGATLVTGLMTLALAQTQHLVVNHRPLPSVLLLSRLLGEHFAGTRYARYFATPSAEAGRG
jgi:hypothetical protein